LASLTKIKLTERVVSTEKTIKESKRIWSESLRKLNYVGNMYLFMEG
jgi:hypothetical protein